MSHLRIPFLILASTAILCGQASPPTAFTVQGRVFSTDGSRLGGVAVEMAGPSTFVAVTESGTDPGHYASMIPATTPAATYVITVKKAGYRSPTPKNVKLDSDKQIDFVLEADCGPCNPNDQKTAWNANMWGTLLAVFVFLASIWLVRWHNIARPNRELLRAEIDNAGVRFQSETGIDLKSPDVQYLKNLLDSARAAIEGTGWRPLFDFLFWTRGQEITGWSRIHEFQRNSIKLLAKESSLETVRARLQAIELDLLEIDKTHAKTFAADIKDALEAKPPLDEPTLRALLVEALTYYNDEDVNTFSQLVGWQTKAVWLAGVGCSLVVLLASTVGNPVLFIAGAAGGYLSRLARTLKRADVPTDYGASWTTLFLSPVVGALSGWFGILLIVVLADSKMQVLGPAFQSIKWFCPLAPFTLGVAFALGFSERLFDGIVSSLDDMVDSDRKAATKPQQPTSTIQAQGANRSPDAGKAADAGKAPDADKAVDNGKAGDA